MSKDRISFFALGGLGEIGLNSYVYNVFNDKENEAIMVDLGMGFSDSKNSSIETFYPNINVLKDLKVNIKALVITHGHEDHIGAIGHLWPQLQCPIYATAWTADLILAKLQEYKLQDKVEIIVVKPDVFYEVGKLRIKWLEVNHSIPDCKLLYIETPDGKKIVHSGDFKISYSDYKAIETFESLGKENIDYLFCDSTNILSSGIAEAESTTKEDLGAIIKKAKGTCWITSFSSNIYRLEVICNIARELNKKIVLLGRSSSFYAKLGVKHGYLNSDVFIEEDKINDISRNKLIFIITGSQGEYRSVLSNLLIGGGYRHKIMENDIMIFSSKVIPGNEIKVNKLYNILVNMGIEFYTSSNYHIHVSGHAKQEDLAFFYDKIQPKYIIPIHGEALHLSEHAKFSNNLGIKSHYILNGEIIDISDETPQIIGKVETGKLVYEGGRLLDINEDLFKKRGKIFYEGSVFVTLLVDKKYDITPIISTEGLLTEDEEEDIYESISLKLKEIIGEIIKAQDMEKSEIIEAARILTRKFFKNKLGKKPIVNVHLASKN